MATAHPALKAIKKALGRVQGRRININGPIHFVTRFGPIVRAEYRLEFGGDSVSLEPVHHFLIRWDGCDEEHHAEYEAFEAARLVMNAAGIPVQW